MFVIAVAAGVVDFFLTLIQEITQEKLHFGLAIRVYAMMHLVLRSAQGLTDLGISLVITALMSSSIIALYLSFSIYTLVPLAIYWLVPFIAVTSLGLLQVLVLPFIYMHEESAFVILKIKFVPISLPQSLAGKPFNLRKLVSRRIRTMRPFTFYAGLYDYRFLKLWRSTNIAIIENISGITISTLLASRN